MSHFFKACVFLLILEAILQAKEPLGSTGTSSPLATIEGDPSAIVAGCVNVITGEFCDFQQDLVSVGTEPLILERSYSSSDSTIGELGFGWHFNHEGFCYKDHPKNKFIWKGSFGTELQYSLDDEKKILDVECLKNGLSNNATGVISAKTNFKNSFFRKKDPEKHFYTLYKGDGSRLLFKEKSDATYFLLKEEKPNLTSLIYSYDRKGCLQHLKLLNQRNDERLALNFTYFDKDSFKHNPLLQVVSSDGQKATYSFKHLKKDVEKLLLTTVERPNGSKEVYEYEHGHYHHKGTPNPIFYDRVSKKTIDDGNFISIDYYKPGQYENVTIENGHAWLNRVHALYSPISSDAQPIKSHTFQYNLPNGSNKAGACGVYDAHKVKTDYHWDDELRLTHVMRYTNAGSPYSMDRLFWGQTGSTSHGNIVSRVFSAGENLFCRCYFYDDRGNVLSEKIYGNLSGKNTQPLTIDSYGMPIENGCEKHEKFYLYDQSPMNLLSAEAEGNRTKKYAYIPNTDLVQMEFTVYNGQIVLRHRYFYDEDCAVTIEIIDNGFSEDPDNYLGATKCKWRFITPHKGTPCGVPDEIREYWQNISTGEMHLEKRVVNTYTKEGWLASQHVFGTDNQYAYQLFWEYNARGQVTKEIDAVGNMILRYYDARGNLIIEHGPRGDYRKDFTYDLSNRLLTTKEIHSDRTLVTENTYDFLGLKRTTVDPYGNGTSYSYDEFGRMIQIIEPWTLDENGIAQQPMTHMAYHAAGNMIRKVDPRGVVHEYEYNIRGQVTKIKYPDGAREEFTYYPEGTLHSKVERNGCMTVYERDYQDRIISTMYYGPDLSILWTTSATFDAFHLLSETDALGRVTHYSYDALGRKKAVQKGDFLETYEYDTLSRISKVNTFSDGQNAISKAYIYNNLGRVIQENSAFEQINYHYDQEGHCTHAITYGSEGAQVSEVSYHSYGLPYKSIDALGNITTSHLLHGYRNTLAQLVAWIEIVDPEGNKTVIIQDAFQRESLFIRTDPMGQVTQMREIFYDLLAIAAGLLKRWLLQMLPHAKSSPPGLIMP